MTIDDFVVGLEFMLNSSAYKVVEYYSHNRIIIQDRFEKEPCRLYSRKLIVRLIGKGRIKPCDMTDEHKEALTKIVRNRLKGEWDKEWKKNWVKAHEESSKPNTTLYIEPLITTLGDFSEGVQQAQKESNFKMMKLLHSKEQ